MPRSRSVATAGEMVAKAVSASQITLTSVTNATPIAVATAKPHGLATGTSVFISGVTGTTAANGQFVITVTDPTAFTLNGSAGNAAWTGGGTATAGLDDAIAAIVVTTLATATAGVIPMKISSGVIRKPPPIPNIPEMKPTASPMARTRKMFTGISAIGR